MLVFINAEVFDHAILHSTMKWTVPSVSTLIEELKAGCPNRTVTQSKWMDATSSKLTVAEAQSYWSVFTASRSSVLGQVGDWIDLQTLGVLLLCQCYLNVRVRAESFHRAEVLAQTLSPPATAPSSPQISPMNRTNTNRNPLLNLSKLLRDSSTISQFVVDNASYFVGMVAVCCALRILSTSCP